MTETQAATSVKSAIESWQFGRDHAMTMWSKLTDPIHAVERSRDLLSKVYLGNLADTIQEKVQDEESVTEWINAAEAVTRAMEGHLLRGTWFEDTGGNPFKRATAEIKCRTAAGFVQRMRRILDEEVSGG